MALDALAQVWAEHAPRLRAVLARRLGDLDLAEEALADAVAEAAQVWPVRGVPAQPGGWLVTAAWHRALDRLRRDQTGRAKLALLAATPPAEQSDDRLALIFGCCHPVLGEPVQVALTLNAVCGLTSAEIAAAFLRPPSVIAQRLVRAKQRLRQAKVKFDIPDPEGYPARLDAVLAVIYLVFNEGFLSTAARPQRRELAQEALDLARELSTLMPREPEVAGLAALIEAQSSRRRIDGQGRLVLLAEQDRGGWDQHLIASATARLDRALAQGRPGRYQTEAAIAVLHASAASAASTDWAQIRVLYTVLHRMQGNPLALLNRAVATMHLLGAPAALSEVEALADRLGSYRLFHATRGELLSRLGRVGEARLATSRALGLATNPAERHLLQTRLTALDSAALNSAEPVQPR
jgi:predicted RNA polymerase sigma factor